MERVTGFCSPNDHLEFMRQHPELEGMLVRAGIPDSLIVGSTNHLIGRDEAILGKRFILRSAAATTKGSALKSARDAQPEF